MLLSQFLLTVQKMCPLSPFRILLCRALIPCQNRRPGRVVNGIPIDFVMFFFLILLVLVLPATASLPLWFMIEDELFVLVLVNIVDNILV